MVNENKLDCMGNYWGTRNGTLQILYLRHKLKMSYEHISYVTTYSIGTINSYLKKYACLLEEALQTFYFKYIRKDLLKYKNMVTYECKKPLPNKYYAYLCEVYDGAERKFLKVGYTADLETRMLSHATNKRYGGDRVKVLKVYEFEEFNDALDMENSLRKYYCAKGKEVDFIKNDRFLEQTVNEKDYALFERRANSIRANDWFA